MYVSPVRYELGFYIPEDAIRHSDRRENLKSYISPRIFIVGTWKGECRHLLVHRAV
jgi:hypothetical protein